MSVTNEEIMDKLNKIETIVKTLTQEGEKAFEVVEDDKNKMYTDVSEWQSKIWEDCPHKKEDNESSEIDFICDITKKKCKFEGCPENIKN